GTCPLPANLHHSKRLLLEGIDENILEGREVIGEAEILKYSDDLRFAVPWLLPGASADHPEYSLVGLQDACQNLDGRRFPRAVMTYEPMDSRTGHLQRDTIECVYGAQPLMNVLDSKVFQTVHTGSLVLLDSAFPAVLPDKQSRISLLDPPQLLEASDISIAV